MRHSRLLALLVLAVAALLPSGSADARRVAYVVDQGAATVAAFTLGADGAAAPLGAPVPTGGASPSFVALTPDGRRAYVTNTGAGTVAAFAIGADGALSALGAPVPAGGMGPAGVAVAPDGSHVYVANQSSDTVSAFRVGADGTLAAVGAPVPSGGISTRQVAVTPDGRFVWAIASSTSTVSTFAIGADGSLTAVGDPVDPVGADLFDVAFAPDGTRAYGVNFGTPDVNPFGVGGDGRPVETGAPVGHGGDMARTIAVAPDGRRVLVPAASSGTVSLLTVDDAGALALAGAVGVGGSAPFAVAVAPGGRFAYATSGGGSLLVFSAPGGPVLTPLGAPVPTGGASPRGIAITPNQGPVAAFTSASASSGGEVRFDAGGSSDPDGAVTSFAWDFGDGTTGSGATPTHVYGRPGRYPVTLTVTDDEGCSARRVLTGKTVHCNGGAAAVIGQAVTVPEPARAVPGDRVAPSLTRLTARRGSRRITFRFALSETSRVRVRLHRLRGGRRVGTRCRAATRARRTRKPCLRALLTATATRTVTAGRRSLALTRRSRFPPGRYRATATAVDAAGNASRPATLRLTIRR